MNQVYLQIYKFVLWECWEFGVKFVGIGKMMFGVNEFNIENLLIHCVESFENRASPFCQNSSKKIPILPYFLIE